MSVVPVRSASSGVDGRGARPADTGPSRVARAAGWTAVAASAVYLAIKVAWVCGGTVGVEDLRGASTAEWAAGNAVTGALGLVGVLVGLVTVRPWGMRVPTWLLAAPAWVGAGLLAPPAVLLPLGAGYAALGWWTPPTTPRDDTPQLATWTFGVVYGSFVVLGVALAVALPAYARRRWGALLGGRVGDGAPGATHAVQVSLAGVAAVLAAGPAALRLWWVLGGSTGLTADTRDVWLRSGDVVAAAQVALAVLGVLVLVHRRGPDRRFAVPLVAAWIGAGGLLGAGFLGMSTILAGDDWAPDGQTFVPYAVSTFLTCVAGSLLSVVTLVLLVERAAGLPAGKPPVPASR